MITFIQILMTDNGDEIMICWKCGKELPAATDKYCPYCGKRVDGKGAHEKNAHEKNARRRKAIIVLGIVIVLIAAVSIFISVSNREYKADISEDDSDYNYDQPSVLSEPEIYDTYGENEQYYVDSDEYKQSNNSDQAEYDEDVGYKYSDEADNLPQEDYSSSTDDTCEYDEELEIRLEEITYRILDEYESDFGIYSLYLNRESTIMYEWHLFGSREGGTYYTITDDGFEKITEWIYDSLDDTYTIDDKNATKDDVDRLAAEMKTTIMVCEPEP